MSGDSKKLLPLKIRFFTFSFCFLLFPFLSMNLFSRVCTSNKFSPYEKSCACEAYPHCTVRAGTRIQVGSSRFSEQLQDTVQKKKRGIKGKKRNHPPCITLVTPQAAATALCFLFPLLLVPPLITPPSSTDHRTVFP